MRGSANSADLENTLEYRWAGSGLAVRLEK
jgi:hypothetical protein